MTKANEALNKMAENARELGLDYELPITMQAGELDCTHAERLCAELRLAEQPAQQEPVAWPCVIAEADFEQNTITLEMQCSDYKVGAGQHWLYTSPPARRTWIGLTDEEWLSLGCKSVEEVRIGLAIEAALRSKNT